MKNFLRKMTLILLLVGSGGYAYTWWDARETPQLKRYKTQAVDRGNIIQSISANGTLNPVILVLVGTQVSGTVYKIHADFNDQVKAGQILAELDPALFQSQVKESEANLLSAQADLKLADINLKRTRNLSQKGLIADADLDTAQQRLEAGIAKIKLAEAQLDRNRTNLRYTIIRSPISGVVVARNVDIGQTVAASFQTPTLFQIAQDLSQMQIDTSVAEADVGSLKVGQAVKFTVDAFPEKTFDGKIKQIRLNPTIQQNVVTYDVVALVDNAEGKLMPGMTAHVYINIDEHKDILRVPNVAFSFKPKSAEENGKSGKEAQPGSVLYVLNPSSGKPRPVKITVGITDNTMTEITSGNLKEGDAVIVKEFNDKRGDSNFRLRMM